MKRFEIAELSLKVFGALIATFGIITYFVDQHNSRRADETERSLSYIDRFGSSDLIGSRNALLSFWKDYPEVISKIRQPGITRNEFRNFVNGTYPLRDDRAEIDEALFRMQAFLDEVAYCRSSLICNISVVDDFFCGYVQRFSVAYEPFYARLSRDIGSRRMDENIMSFAEVCVPNTSPSSRRKGDEP